MSWLCQILSCLSWYLLFPGLILGTGTNACYLEEVKDIHTIDQEAYKSQKHMVINTEWGAFGENGKYIIFLYIMNTVPKFYVLMLFRWTWFCENQMGYGCRWVFGQSRKPHFRKNDLWHVHGWIDQTSSFGSDERWPHFFQLQPWKALRTRKFLHKICVGNWIGSSWRLHKVCSQALSQDFLFKLVQFLT